MCTSLGCDRWGTLSVTKSHSLPFKQPAVSHCYTMPSRHSVENISVVTLDTSHISISPCKYCVAEICRQTLNQLSFPGRKPLSLAAKHCGNPEAALTPQVLHPDGTSPGQASTTHAAHNTPEEFLISPPD